MTAYKACSVGVDFFIPAARGDELFGSRLWGLVGEIGRLAIYILLLLGKGNCTWIISLEPNIAVGKDIWGMVR